LTDIELIMMHKEQEEEGRRSLVLSWPCEIKSKKDVLKKNQNYILSWFINFIQAGINNPTNHRG
jgi:hypothetical protein